MTCCGFVLLIDNYQCFSTSHVDNPYRNVRFMFMDRAHDIVTSHVLTTCSAIPAVFVLLRAADEDYG